MKSCDLIYIDLSLIVACVSVDSCSNWDRRKNCLWPVTYNWCTLGACTANRQVQSVGIHTLGTGYCHATPVLTCTLPCETVVDC